MKGKIVIVSLLVVLLLSTFSTALAATKTPAVFTATRYNAQTLPDGVRTDGGTWFTDDTGIAHVFDAHRYGKIYLLIGSGANAKDYVGRVDVSVDYIIDPNTKTTTQHYHKMTMTFLASVNTGIGNSDRGNKLGELKVDSTFNGVNTWSATLKAPYYTIDATSGLPTAAVDSTIPIVMHGLLHGTGDFEGYILHLQVGTDTWIQIR